MATPSYHNRKTVPSLRPRPLTPTQRALLAILFRAPSYVVFGLPAPDAPGCTQEETRPRTGDPASSASPPLHEQSQLEGKRHCER